MRACVLHAAMDLRLEERPDLPLENDHVRVRFGAGGICGSDLHYYFDGRVGDFAVREPLILGHEVAGEVIEVGAAVARVKVGDRVAVNPSLPCWQCRACQAGRTNLCARMTFFGSAAVMPHIQGAFREQLVAHESQCFAVPASTPFAIAAMAEPLAVCLHAVQRAGALPGAHVLITGCGPIGALTCLAARHAGAARITITDVADAPLAVAERVGADKTVNVARSPERIEGYKADKGWFDVAFEASGNPQALITCLDCTRPGGRIVQLGMLPPGRARPAADPDHAQGARPGRHLPLSRRLRHRGRGPGQRPSRRRADPDRHVRRERARRRLRGRRRSPAPHEGATGVRRLTAVDASRSPQSQS